MYHKYNEHDWLLSILGVNTHAWKSVGRATAQLQVALAHLFQQRCHHIVLVLLSMVTSTQT